MFWVYIIYNRIRNKIYIGHTQDIEIRLKRHNNELPNKPNSYTHINSGEWKLVYSEKFQSRKEAKLREKQLKTAKGRVFAWKQI